MGIGLESSPNTKVYNNTVYIEYQNAIEYRFAATKNVKITNNITNKAIKLGDGAQASLAANNTSAEASWFEDVKVGNLRVFNYNPNVSGKGLDLSPDVTRDIDKYRRDPQKGIDIGVSQYYPAGVDEIGSNSSFRIDPNPNSGRFQFHLPNHFETGSGIARIYDSRGKLVYQLDDLTASTTFSVDLKAGIYSMSITNKEGSSLWQKLVLTGKE